MLTLIAKQLTRWLPQTGPARDTAADDDEPRDSGWHQSSWDLAQGVEVIELPATAIAVLFPDTQPAFYCAGDDDEPLAA